MQVVVEEEAWFAILYGSLVVSTNTGALMFRKDDLSLPCFLCVIEELRGTKVEKICFSSDFDQYSLMDTY